MSKSEISKFKTKPFWNSLLGLGHLYFGNWNLFRVFDIRISDFPVSADWLSEFMRYFNLPLTPFSRGEGVGERSVHNQRQILVAQEAVSA
jgi:hypothetical protein